MKLRALIFLFMIASLCSAADTPTSSPTEKTPVFSCRAEAGDYVFVGIDKGKGIPEYEQGQSPRLTVHVALDSTEKWEVKVSVNPVTIENNINCKFSAVWQRTLFDGTKLNRLEMKWEETLPTGIDVKPMKFDSSVKMVENDKVQAYRLPYANVGHQYQNLVIFVSKDREAIEKAVKIPTSSLFIWKNAWVESPDVVKP